MGRAWNKYKKRNNNNKFKAKLKTSIICCKRISHFYFDSETLNMTLFHYEIAEVNWERKYWNSTRLKQLKGLPKETFVYVFHESESSLFNELNVIKWMKLRVFSFLFSWITREWQSPNIERISLHIL